MERRLEHNHSKIVGGKMKEMTIKELKKHIESLDYSTEDFLGDLKAGDTTEVTEARTGRKQMVKIKNSFINGQAKATLEIMNKAAKVGIRI